MNRIVLIGNGFDLAHGLKTGYGDFMSHYWKGIAKKIPEYMFAGFKDEFIKFERTGGPESLYVARMATDYGQIYDFKNEKKYRYQDAFGRGIIPEFCKALTEVDSYLDLKKLIADVNELSDLQFNLSFSNSFFGHLSETLSLNSWIDIENEYYYMLKRTLSDPNSPSINELNNEFEDIKNSLVEYLKSICDQEVSKIDSLDDILNSSIRLDDIALSEQDAFLDNILYSIATTKGDMEASFDINDYHRYGFKTKEEALRSQLKSNISEGQYDESYLYPQNTLFLNFNYTNTEQLYATGNLHLIHIHGELDNPNNPIIFGYGDEMDEHYKSLVNLNNNDYLQNIKSIRYLETENYRKLLEFIESDAYQIFVMGHSCSNSDRTLLNTLFEHKNCMSIKPFYYQREGGTDDYRSIVQNISRNFKDPALMRDRVVNKTYCEPFPQLLIHSEHKNQ